MIPREAREDLLRSLPDEIPPQVGVHDEGEMGWKAHGVLQSNARTPEAGDLFAYQVDSDKKDLPCHGQRCSRPGKGRLLSPFWAAVAESARAVGNRP